MKLNYIFKQSDRAIAIATKLLGSLVLILAMSISANATHIAGGDMSYKCLGNDLYEITVTIRRDCENGLPAADFDDPLSVGVFDPVFNNILNQYGTFGQLLIPFADSDTLNETLSSDCGFIGTQVCVQQATYKGTIELPFRNRGYTLAYQRCCRNVSLNNIVAPLETGSTYHVTISEDALNTCNSSPTFNEWPDIYICANQPLVYSHLATDVDGDSLVYKLCVPNSGATQDAPLPQPANNPPFDEVNFLAPYDLNDMMGGVPLQIDPQTGVVTATPTLIGQYLIGICVEEYRDGVLLSSVKRDFEYNVRVCGVAPVALFDTDSPLCGSLEASFTNNSTDADAYKWFFDYPNDDFSLTSTEENPTFTYPGPGTYEVRLEAIRSIDQCSTSITKTIIVSDSDVVASFDASLSLCSADSYSLNLLSTSTDSDPTQSITDLAWTVTQGGVTSTYTGNDVEVPVEPSIDAEITLVVTSSNGCTAETTESILPTSLVAVGSFSAVLESCTVDGFNIVLTDTSIGNNTTANSWSWTIIDGANTITSNENPFSVVVSNITDLSVELITGFTNDCEVTTEENITMLDGSPAVDFSLKLRNCQNGGYFIELTDQSAHNTFVPSSYEWLITYASGLSDILSGSSVVAFIDNGSIVDIQLTVDYENACSFDKIVEDISVDSIIDMTAIAATVEDCSGDGSVEINLSASFDSGYLLDENTWVVSVNGQTPVTGTGSAFSLIVNSGDVLEISTETLYSNGCSTSSTESITIEGVVVDFLSSPIAVCTGQSSLIVANPNSNWTYNWAPMDGLSFVDINDQSNPLFVGTESTTYNVTVTNGMCDVVSSVAVGVFDEFDLSISGNTLICDGNVELQVSGAANTDEYIWSLDPDFNTIIFTGANFTTTQDSDSVTYYASTSENSSCPSDIESITVVNNGLSDLIFGDNVSVCPNDQFVYAVMSNSGQDIDVVFNADPHIIAGANTATPTILVGLDESEDFTLTFTASNSAGCSIEQEVTFIVSTNQQLAFTSEITCGTTEVCFVNTSPVVNAFQFFDFGDGSTSVQATDQCYTYSSPGSYTVTLSSTLNFCPGINAKEEITIGDVLVLTVAGATTTCDGSVNLTVSGAASGDGYEWSTDAGFSTIVATTANLNTTFTGTSQTYYVRTDADATCPAEAVSFVVTNGAINVNLATPFEACPGDEFVYTVDFGTQSITTIVWTADSHITAGANTNSPTISIGADETAGFSLSFDATNDLGCTYTGVVDFIIGQVQQLSFTAAATCGTTEICLVNTSPSVNANQFFDFGDGSTPVQAIDQCYTYTAAGDYTISLTSNAMACQGLATSTSVSVDGDAMLSITGNASTCDGSVNLTVSGAASGDGYEWSTDSDFSTIIATTANLNTTFAGASQTYYVRTDADATCPAEAVSFVVTNGAINVNLATPFEACPGDEFVYTVDFGIQNITTIVWTADQHITAGANTNSPTISIGADETAGFSLSFDATNDLGCTYTGVVDFIIGQVQQLSFTASATCGTTEICLVNTSPSVNANQFFDFGDGSTPVQAVDQCYTYATAGDYTISLSSNAMACQGLSTSTSVSVDGDAMLSITGSAVSCDGSVDLTVSGAAIGDGYEWSSEADFSSILATTANLNTTFAGASQTYYVRTDADAICPAEPISIVVTKGMVDIDLDSSFDVCQGDQFIYVLDIDPSIITEVIWNDDSHFVSGLNTSQPVIQIGTDESNDFPLSFTATDVNGCSADFEVLFVISQAPTLSFDFAQQCGTTIVCFDNTSSTQTGQVFDFGDGSDPVVAVDTCYQYASIGTYNVTLLGNAQVCNGEPVTSLVPVNQSADLTIVGDTVACDNNIDLTVSGAPLGFDYEWSTSPDFSTIVGTGSNLNITMIGTSQTYYVQVQNNDNCVSEIDSIRVQDGFFDVEFVTPFQICQDDSVAFNVIPVPNIMTTIQWEDHPNIIGGANTTMPVISVGLMQTGSFTLTFTATSILGCTKTKDVEFVIVDNPILSFDAVTECNSLTVCVTNTTADQVGLYGWNFGDGNPDVLSGDTCYTYATNGVYPVSLFNIASVCPGMTETQNVTISDQVNLTIDGERMICNGEINLQVSGALPGDDYKWSTTSDFNSIVTVGDTYTGNLVTDSLTLYVMTDDNATCMGMTSVTVYNDMFGLSFLSPFEACAGDEFAYTVISNDPSVVFDWEDSDFIVAGGDTGMPTISLPNDQTGSIELPFSASNGAGCVMLDTAIITIVERPQLTFDYTIDCGGLEVCFEADPDNLSIYFWQFGEGGLPATGEQVCYTYAAIGEYQVTLSTVSPFCQASPAFENITITDTEPISVTGDLYSCDGFTNITASGAGVGDGFVWSENTDFDPIISMDNPLIYEMTQDTQTYYVMTDADASCQSAVDSFTVIDASIDVVFADTVSICAGQSMLYTVINNKPQFASTIFFGSDPHILGNGNTFIPTIGTTADETGEFTIVFTVSNDVGCTETFEVLFMISSELNMDFTSTLEECGETTICFENTNLNSNVEYFWDFGDLTTMTDTTSLFDPGCYTYPGPGTYDVTLTANSDGCGMMQIVKTITVPGPLDITVTSLTPTVCAGDDYTIMATEASGAEISYCLENGEVLGTGPELTVNFDVETLILVKATDSFGCSDTTLWLVDIFDFQLIGNGPEVVVCAGDEIEVSVTNLDATGNYTYAWAPVDCIVSGGDTANPIISAQESKAMTVTVTNTDIGCSTTIDVPVEISSVDVSILPDIFGEIKAGVDVELTVQNVPDNPFFEWSNDPTVNSESQIVTPIVTTTYVVTVTDEFACTGTAEYTVEVRDPLCSEEDIFVPLAFTPNDDGVNDVLYVRSAIVMDIEFTIVDRWGKQLFISRDVNSGWDGTFNGEKLSPDVYAYCIKATCIDQETFIKSGNVSLLK